MSLMDSFNELEPKQKATLIVTLILMGFVVYLGYDTFYPEGFGGGNTPTTVTKAPPPQYTANGTITSSANPGEFNGGACTDRARGQYDY